MGCFVNNHNTFLGVTLADFDRLEEIMGSILERVEFKADITGLSALQFD